MNGGTAATVFYAQAHVLGCHGCEAYNPFVTDALFACGFGNGCPLLAVVGVLHTPARGAVSQFYDFLRHQAVEGGGAGQGEGDIAFCVSVTSGIVSLLVVVRQVSGIVLAAPVVGGTDAAACQQIPSERFADALIQQSHVQ